MIDKYYNPYDIYKNEKVKQHLQDVIKKISPKSSSVGDQIATSTFSYITGVTNFLGVGFAKLLEIGTNFNLQQMQREQIVYLEKHPEDIRRELRVNLIVSILYLKDTFEIKEKMDSVGFVARTIWKSIKKLSFQEGLAESLIDSMERHRSEKWIILRSPMALLMNCHYLNKNISLVRTDSYLADLINAGEHTTDIDDLCTYQFKSSFLYGTVKNYLEVQFDKLIAHVQINKKTFPQLDEMLEKCISLRESQVKELKEQEEKAYEYYRNEIVQWSKDYPAKEDSKNFQMVINTLRSFTDIPRQNYRLNTDLVEDLKISQEQREKLCEEFYKIKDFHIDNIYMEKFKTIAEVVSFWNAFDNLDPLDMTP